MRVNLKFGTPLALVAGVAVVFSTSDRLRAQQGAPQYVFDPTWPKPLPNKWKIGGIMGIAPLPDGSVWVYTRPNDMRDLELLAELTPPAAECCVRPHSLIRFDKNGNVIESSDPPQGHGLDVDSKGFLYLGQNTVRKYDPKSGKVVAEVPRAPEREGGGGGDEGTPAARVPGRGGPGPTGTFPQPPRPAPDPAARAKAAAATAAFRVKYPPSTPMIVGQVEEVRVVERDNEIYVADSYLGGRILVFDLTTFAFKRGWGAYGKPLAQMSTDDADRAYKPGGPMPKEFRGHLTVNVSNDGLVYAADRNANRIHVTTKDGKFLKEFIVAPQTGPGRGSTGGVAFSADRQQRFLYISDIANSKIWLLNREDGKIVGQMGSFGENGGQWFGLHMIAVDSEGNIYTGEVFNGERVQRFVPADSPRGKLLTQLFALR